MTPDIQSYLLSWSNEIEARSNRVRQLIGDAHWLSDGHHKESLLREFLVRYLPLEVRISRGFVKSTSDFRRCSPEVDILLADPRLNPPLFSEGDLLIVDSTAVAAQIEVKTTFNKKNLNDALQNVGSTQLLIGDFREAAQVWKGVCFFAGGVDRTPESFWQTTKDCLTEVSASFSKQDLQFVAPTCIATLDRYCCFIDQTAPTKVTVKICDVGKLSFPCAFADLFSALRRRNGGAVLGGLDNVVESLDVAPPLVKELSL
jgi:hypothetical protein